MEEPPLQDGMSHTCLTIAESRFRKVRDANVTSVTRVRERRISARAMEGQNLTEPHQPTIGVINPGLVAGNRKQQSDDIRREGC